MPLELHPLGSQGLRTPRLGLGVMSAAFYGSGDTKADEEAQLAALDKLVELAAPSPAFIDTAWIYAHPTGLHSEEIVAKSIAKHGRERFIIATKFGTVSGSAPCSSTEVIHAHYADSLRRLGTRPDLYYQHRPDLKRPIEEVRRLCACARTQGYEQNNHYDHTFTLLPAQVMADLKAMHAEGKFLYAGLSECTAAELRRAHAVFPVSAIQMEWSIAERGVEAALVPTCAELGVGAWR